MIQQHCERRRNTILYNTPALTKPSQYLFPYYYSFIINRFLFLIEFVGVLFLLFALEKSSTNMRREQERPNNRTNQQKKRKKRKNIM